MPSVMHAAGVAAVTLGQGYAVSRAGGLPRLPEPRIFVTCITCPPDQSSHPSGRVCSFSCLVHKDVCVPVACWACTGGAGLLFAAWKGWGQEKEGGVKRRAEEGDGRQAREYFIHFLPWSNFRCSEALRSLVQSSYVSVAQFPTVNADVPRVYLSHPRD